MSENKKQSKEIAVIFKKKTRKDGLNIYIPESVEIGKFNNKTKEFETINGEKFPYLMNYTNLEYCFGIRENLKQITEEFNIKNKYQLEYFLQQYTKELKQYIYQFQVTSSKDYETTILVAINKKTKKEIPVNDANLDLARKILTSATKLNFDTKTLSEYVKKRVIAQDEAIDNIVTIIWQNLRKNKGKSNILLVGPTAVGKTEITRCISEYLKIPMVTIKATDLTQTGYVGQSASDAIQKLIRKANYDINKASRGIIVIDEIDKKGTYSNEIVSGIGTTGVQDELLALLEDGEYEINISNNPFIKQIETISTKNITFICCGAFTSLERKLKENNNKSIGFNSKEPEKKEIKTIYQEVTPEDLITIGGLKPELVGRLHNIIVLNHLNKENLIDIMKNPNNRTIQENRNILEDLGIKLTIEEEVYNILAEAAEKKKVGARGLVGSLDKLFLNAMTEISRNQNTYNELIITKDTILDNSKYTLVKRKK